MGFNWSAAAALGTWALIIGGVLWYAVRTTIRAMLDEAIIKLNGTYVRAGGTEVTGAEIVRRLQSLEDRRASAASVG